MAYKNIIIQKVCCFGKQSPENESWSDILISATKNFSKAKENPAFENSLAKDIEASYYRIITFFIKDIDTDFEYAIFFDNHLKLWNVEFKYNSRDNNIDILPNQKNDLLRNDMIKKAIHQADLFLRRAKDLIDNVIMQHIEEGDLLKVDETKLEAIMFFLNEKIFKDNFINRKYAR